MLTNLDQLDVTKRYSYADYLTWHFKERVELIKGWVHKMSPAPLRKHQGISLHLTHCFYNFLKNKECKVYDAPFDVRLKDNMKSSDDHDIYTVVQPDISIICDAKKLDEKGCVGAPDLIIEIVSKGNTKFELENKFKLYEENGVLEYWVVQQGDETVVVFDLKDNVFQFRKIYSNDEIIPVGIFTELEIDLKEVFGNL